VPGSYWFVEKLCLRSRVVGDDDNELGIKGIGELRLLLVEWVGIGG
jgi:hypothetical protein